jgi:N-methylhydantoinase B/oxoprolinase/acetone carboxylase alpha subunit
LRNIFWCAVAAALIAPSAAEAQGWEQACGGGYGDPFERDPALVLRDWREELVSAASAERDYGVVIDVAADAVDEAATAQRRGALGSQTRGG